MHTNNENEGLFYDINFNMGNFTGKQANPSNEYEQFNSDEPTLDEEQLTQYFNKLTSTRQKELSSVNLLGEVIIGSTIMDQTFEECLNDELNSTQLSIQVSSQELIGDKIKKARTSRKTIAALKTIEEGDNSAEINIKKRRGKIFKSIAPEDIENIHKAVKKKLPENQPTLDSFFKENKSKVNKIDTDIEVVCKKPKLIDNNNDKENCYDSKINKVKNTRRTTSFRKYNSADSAIVATRSSTRINKAHNCVKLMTTGILLSEKDQKIITNLGGQLVFDAKECTHLIANWVIKSWKFLSCLNRGISIVSSNYLETSKRANMFLATSNSQLLDVKAEKQFRFSLDSSLSKAKSSPLLTDWKFLLNCKGTYEISVENLKTIIECGNGQVVGRIENNSNDKYAILYDTDEELRMNKIDNQGVIQMTTDSFYTCILRQNFP